ncbi:MAG: Hpt domain-containing protein [Deltaproteobacteria bacterium]|nr:Hpt domain-containing protein [Deltaproteobacteria bacterium]
MQSKAYKVFCEEFQRHIEEFQAQLDSGQDIATERRKHSARFHTIRGGSGFFGLSVVSQLSGALEDLLLEEGFSSENDLPKVKSYFESLKLEAQKLLENS